MGRKCSDTGGSDDSRNLFQMMLNREAAAYYIEHGCVACSLQEELGVSCDTSDFPCPRCTASRAKCLPVCRPMDQLDAVLELLSIARAQ